MSAVRQELLEQIDRLDESQQKQLLDYIRVLVKPASLTWAQWLALAEQAQHDLRATYGDKHYFDTQSVLDEVREGRLDDLMGSH